MTANTCGAGHQHRLHRRQKRAQETIALLTLGLLPFQGLLKGTSSPCGINKARQNRNPRTSMDNISIRHVAYRSCKEHNTASNVRLLAAATATLNGGINHSPPRVTSLSWGRHGMDLMQVTTHILWPTCPAARTLQNYWNYTSTFVYRHTSHSIDQQ